MNRRTFFGGLGAGGAGLCEQSGLAQQGRAGKLRIRDLEFWRVEGIRDSDGGLNRQYQAQPLHVYPEHRPKAYADPTNPVPGRVPISAIYLESFAALRWATGVPVATGEHLYGRWEVQRYLQAGAITVVQSDPEWCGGTSELVKICHIASVYDAQVIPHGHNIHAAQHVVASQSPITCPLVEYLLTKMATYYFFDLHPPVPVKAHLELSDRPGFGMELDEAKIAKRTRLSWS